MQLHFFCPSEEAEMLFQQNKYWGQIGSNLARTESQVDLHNNFLFSLN